MKDIYRKIGAQVNDDGSCDFTVWAPLAKEVSLLIKTPREKIIPMTPEKFGYWHITVQEQEGVRYYYMLDKEKTLPDPASKYQPEGVHGPSEIVDTKRFRWSDGEWKNIAQDELIFYELHTGTFSDEETFEGITGRIPYLLDLGITAIELMPVAQFPGRRNWGYDGVYPFAIQNSYGGPAGLMKLVDTCHRNGLAVFLDVVYNHLGPEGNYLGQYAPYFTGKYNTPWGQAINYDDSFADGVRNYFLQNVIMWFEDYHLDGLRLDAVHSIFDFGARHIMLSISEEVERINRESGKQHYVIAESALNDSRYINKKEQGGYNLNGQWNDDFHHGVHVMATGEKMGYYMDFEDPGLLVNSLKYGFAYDGQFSPFRNRCFGNPSHSNPGSQFVVFSQNHDQVGNRKMGERLSTLVSYEMLKLIAGMVMSSPFLPMLFMGEEYGEKNPFLYFVDHGDEKLKALVNEGRQNEFKSFFPGDSEPAPEPSDIETFRKSKLLQDPLSNQSSKALFDYYRFLITLKKEHPVLKNNDKKNLVASQEDKVFSVERWQGSNRIICWLNFSDNSAEQVLPETFSSKATLLLNSSEAIWNGPDHIVPQSLNPGGKVKLNAQTMLIYSA